MQTFLPYPDFLKSAICLDDKRLSKQRVEGLQILKALSFGPYQMKKGDIWVSCDESTYKISKLRKDKMARKTPWFYHPATKMWRNYENKLMEYVDVMCSVWIGRGGDDTVKGKIKNFPIKFVGNESPFWLGNERFHAGHRSNLLRKKPEWYGRFNWSESDNLPYVWPK